MTLRIAVRFTDIVIEHSGYRDPVLRQGKTERNLRLLHREQAELLFLKRQLSGSQMV